MLDIQNQNSAFVFFQKKYENILEKCLKDEKCSEISLHEANLIGHLAIAKEIGILSVVAIHHNYLSYFLGKLETDNFLDITNRSSLFLKSVLSSYQMVENDFGNAIHLLNKKMVELAVRHRVLQESLKEKDLLLKETHHRFKNNLQVISSLINLQVGSTSDTSAHLVLTESVTRVKSITLVHEMLYQSGNLERVAMKDYVIKLLNYLHEIYSINLEKIKHHLDIGAISLSLDKTILCGLIINELISNVFKHAFLENKNGEINLSFTEHENNFILIVSDNGVGISSNFDFQNADSLGMKLIYNLTKQLHGKISLDCNRGTSFTLNFCG